MRFTLPLLIVLFSCATSENPSYDSQEFYEKEKNPPGNKANGAIYVFSNSFLSELGALGPELNDFSKEVLPKFLGRIFTWHTNKPFLDIGTPDNLEKAQSIWPATATESL